MIGIEGRVDDRNKVTSTLVQLLEKFLALLVWESVEIVMWYVLLLDARFLVTYHIPV
jgi:hypothetical protein